jgi:hypothetical protein
MSELPCLTLGQKVILEAALAAAWDDLKLGSVIGCSSVQAARYFAQHLDASIPYLQRLAAGSQEQPVSVVVEDLPPRRPIPDRVRDQLELTLTLASRLRLEGYAPSDAIQTAALLASTHR